MNADLYVSSVTVFDRGLAGLSAVLRKGMAHAAAQSQTEAELLQARLHPSMYPLYRQAQIVSDFARQTPSRVLGRDVPPALEGEMDHAELQRQIVSSRAFLAQLDHAEFAGRDQLRIRVPVNDEPREFSVAGYVLGFATPNFYFHLVTAYAILRHLGVPLGKLDYFGVATS